MQIRTIMGTILFFLLIVRGVYYINQTNVPRRKDYTDGWNLLMVQLNWMQKFVFGEIKMDMLQFHFNGVVQQSIFVRNMGVVYIVSAGAALSKSSIIRVTALCGLLALSFLFGRAKTTTSLTYEDLLEKYQHLLLGVLIGLFIMTEPRTYDESRKERIVKGYIENYKQSMANGQRLNENIEGSNEVVKKQENSVEMLKREKREEHKYEEIQRHIELEREERVRQAQELDQKLREQEEENQRIQNEEEEEEEQNRKFKVDEDGFSVVPNKCINKVQGQQQHTNEQNQKKKGLYDDI